jgi:hypothetical protein
VESQEAIATRALVDDLGEQSQLEDILDRRKPDYPPETQALIDGGLHYLLATPFRYPPLRAGSRFGSADRRGIFYGAQAVATALAETAYYRFRFWHAMSDAPASPLQTQHTIFSVDYDGPGVALHEPPFDAWHAKIADPCSYAETQPLGNAMRANSVTVFEFPSARDPGGGHNVGLFTPTALAQLAPKEWIDNVLCETGGACVQFWGRGLAYYVFRVEIFLVDGRLPRPGLDSP